MKNWEEIDRHSRDALDNWSEEPSPLVAEKIRKRMFWFNFWRSGIIANLKYILPSAIITGIFISVLLLTRNDQESASPNKVISNRNVSKTAIAQTAIPEADKTIHEPDQTLAGQDQTKSNKNSTANVAIHSTNLNEKNLNAKKENNIAVTANINADENKTDLSKLTASSKMTTSKAEQNDVKERSTKQTSQIASDEHEISILSSKSNSENILSGHLLMNPIQSHFPYIACCDKDLIAQKVIDSKLPSSKSKLDYYLGISYALVNFSNTQEQVKTTPRFPSGSISLGMDYHFKNMFLESGLQYSYLQMKENGGQLLYNPKNIVTQTYAGQMQVVDTTSFWHTTFVLDSIIHFVDSIWETHYDTTMMNVYIPVTSTEYDTLKGSHSWKANISIIEIPILTGYTFSIAKTAFSIKAGVLFGIITQSGGYTYSKSSPTGLMRISDAYSTQKIQCSYIVAAGISRYLSENLSVEFTPYMRSSINGLKSKVEGIPSRKYMAWGLGVGLRYKF